MGNHDLALAGALRVVPAAAACNWPLRYASHYNAETTFASYGVAFGDLRGLARAMPPAHKRLLAGLPWRVEHPQYLIVHAGLLPDRPFDGQLDVLRRRDFSLNRPPWLSEPSLAHAPVPADCPLTVVSGHVRVPSVTFGVRRVLVDTTGGTAGDLSAVLLPDNLVVTSAGPDDPALDAASTPAPPRRHRFGKDNHDRRDDP